MIPPIFISSMLKTDMRNVKNATQDSLAIITDGSRGNYLFGGEDGLENEIAEAAWEEANAERIADGIERGREDFARGNYVVGVDAAISRSEQMRHERMQAAYG